MRSLHPARLGERVLAKIKGDPKHVEERWYDVSGLRWHARVSSGAGSRGDRPKVVLLHGLVISSSFHEPFIDRLAADFDVYAPDLPGYGKSESPGHIHDMDEQADAVAEWMEAAGLRSAAVLGTSYGAQLAADFAVRHPDRVERIVLVGPVLEPEARRLPRLAIRWFRHSRFERRQMPLMWLDAIRAGPRRSFALFRLMLKHRLEDVAPAVQAPALVVWGTCDLIVSRAWAEEVTRMLPRGSLAVLPGVPHPANFTSPDELAGVVRPFLLEGADRSGDEADQPGERRVEAHL